MQLVWIKTGWCSSRGSTFELAKREFIVLDSLILSSGFRIQDEKDENKSLLVKLVCYNTIQFLIILTDDILLLLLLWNQLCHRFRLLPSYVRGPVYTLDGCTNPLYRFARDNHQQ
jgi:hypothetical protein